MMARGDGVVFKGFAYIALCSKAVVLRFFYSFPIDYCCSHSLNRGST